INACWTHKVSKTELEVIHEEGFLISIIHGRHDVIAQISHAQKLAEKLYPLARMVELPGGHLVSHERTKEITKLKRFTQLARPQDYFESLYSSLNSIYPKNLTERDKDHLTSLGKIFTNRTEQARTEHNLLATILYNRNLKSSPHSSQRASKII
ncbi:alpha/beta hydrolase fold-1, partial [Tanacetum coccineum]